MFGGIFLGVSLPMLIIFLATGFAPWYIILFFIPFILIGLLSEYGRAGTALRLRTGS